MGRKVKVAYLNTRRLERVLGRKQENTMILSACERRVWRAALIFEKSAREKCAVGV